MGGSSGGGGSSNGTTLIRYADYVEARHNDFLLTMNAHRNAALQVNPYTSFETVPVDVGFFGAGYVLGSFPALYDIYGKFIAGLDIDALWEEIYDSTINSPAVNNSVAAESALLSDEMDTVTLPRFLTGMRDLNACMSSSFIMGKALIEDGRQKTVAKFSADLKFKLTTMAQDRWKSHLAWNSEVVNHYANIMKHYFTIKQGITEMNHNMRAKQYLWPFEVLDYERAGLGALQGATKTTSSTDAGGGSKAGGVLGGALSGAAVGGSIGGGYGAAIGAVVGGIAGALS